jgi:uncharacterized metal-binding protein
MSPYFNYKPTLRQKRTAVRHWLLGTTFRFTVLGLMIAFGVLYVAQTSAVSTKGYDLTDLTKLVQNLQRENDEYSIKKNGKKTYYFLYNKEIGMLSHLYITRFMENDDKIKK